MNQLSIAMSVLLFLVVAGCEPAVTSSRAPSSQKSRIEYGPEVSELSFTYKLFPSAKPNGYLMHFFWSRFPCQKGFELTFEGTLIILPCSAKEFQKEVQGDYSGFYEIKSLGEDGVTLGYYGQQIDAPGRDNEK